jgi:RNA-directed DNA polymerase
MPIFPRYHGPSLIAQVCGVENLTLAWRRVRSNIQVARRGRSAGPDAVTLRDFEADWARQMAQLADDLRQGSYRPLPPRRVNIPKPSGGQRAIAILAVRDRVAQRAVQQVLDPLFDPLLLDCSYGCRPLVGVPDALARVERYAAQGLTWTVDADVAAYFDAIDHRILLALVRQRIDEAPLLQLLARWLEVGALNEAETAPLIEPTTSLLARGGATVRRALAWGAAQAPPPMPALPPDPADPYAAGAWEQPASAGFGAPSAGLLGPLGGAPGIEQHLWTAMVLGKPLLSAARMALPYARRLGGRRLALAGALAAARWPQGRPSAVGAQRCAAPCRADRSARCWPTSTCTRLTWR